MNIRKLIIEDVRCFAGRQEFNIRPLTFLVGENSTGKSTVLGCFQTLYTFIIPRAYGSLDFNVEPYQMGVFADIVRRATPKKKNFMLGFEFKLENEGEEIRYFLTLTEKEKGSEPVVQEEKLNFPSGEVVFVGERQESEGEYGISYGVLEVIGFSEKDENKFFRVRASSPFQSMNALEILNLAKVIARQDRKKPSSMEEEFYKWLESAWKSLERRWDRPYNEYSYSFAPIRSKPQRTYDPLKETISPEGSDIPMTLMNEFRTDRKAWGELKRSLVKFGVASELFADIDVRRLGRSAGDPFQLQIKVKGPKVNMIDVGYGVNQLLPILVRILNARQSTTFLMQQPEVHLHPRGQAELSSMLIDLVKQKNHEFVIETHSDYIIDRARIEIMNKKIAPEDVSLIYLEPTGSRVKVHNVVFDDQANLLGAPSSYRKFFLKESDKLLGLD